MFRGREIHSVSVRLGWWFHNFVFCVGLTLRGDTISLYSVWGQFGWYCHSEGAIGNFGKIKINAYLFISDMLR